MNLVGYQLRVGLAGILTIAWVGSSGYGLTGVLGVGERSPNGRRYIFGLVGDCVRDSR